MIGYIVVDDDHSGRDTLKYFLDKYCQDTECLGEAENVDEAYELITLQRPDLVFLDITMPGNNGFMLLEKAEHYSFEVIFVTAHDEYAIKAIRKDAVDYLLKPINIEELKQAVQRAEGRIDEKKTKQSTVPQPASLPDKIAVPIRDGYTNVHIPDIIYCEADEGYTWLCFAEGGKMLVSRTLREFEGILGAYGFIRVHRHHLINPRHVIKYTHGRGGQVLMSGDIVIEVAQRKRQLLLASLDIMNARNEEA